MGTPIKVLFVNHMPVICGAVQSLLLLLRHFREGEVEALVLSPAGPAFAAFERAGFAVREIPVPSKFASSPGVPLRRLRLLSLLVALRDFRAGKAIRRAIRDFRPDIVHLNERSLFHAAWVCKREGVPVVMHARNVADRETRWVHWITVKALRSLANEVIAIDGSVRQSLREVKQCRIVYNPARCEGGDSIGHRRPVEAGNRTRFLYLSVLREFKGIWDLLEAARLLKDRRDIEFIVAGGNSRPPEFYQTRVSKIAGALGYAPDVEREVKAFVKKHGLEGSVRLMGHVTDVDALFDEADVNIFPSWLNGPSRSVFEAGLREIPSILTLRDRVEDVVEDGKTGLIVPDRDPDALAAAIGRLADDPEGRQGMGSRARAKFLELFDARRSAEEVFEIYQRLNNEELTAEILP